ncbi:MAG: hypothetical protein JWP21_1485 [Tardiphaga sp.]|nr:hypothetical protein [Tardiphaga sp.]
MRFPAFTNTFKQSEAGNIAVTFALALLPMLTFVGAAIDYSITSAKRSRVQTMLDSAMLAGAIAGKKSLDTGVGSSVAITEANTAAANFFAGNSDGFPSTLTANFSVSGSTLTGVGSAVASVPTNFMKIVGIPIMTFSVHSGSSSNTQPYVNVYLLIDISASMLLPSTDAGIAQMRAGQGCALACHDRTDGKDSYGWSLKNGVQLRYQVVNQGVDNLLTYLNNDATLKAHVKVGLWSFDHALSQMSQVTSNYSTVKDNFPTPSLASNDVAAATPFDNLIDNFVGIVGKGGDGSSSGSPKKMVIIATDGVNDPTREWISNTSIRPQVKVFSTGFCKTFETNNVIVAIINTPYLPMTWDWGYNATLGQPGSLGGATRVDDIPIALKACAGNYFTVAADVASIQSSFTKLFTMTSAIRLTK